jgi:hypothetical protein
VTPSLLPVVGVVFGSLAALTVGVVALVRKVRRRKDEALAEIERDVLRGRAPRRLETANFLGLLSKGPVQLRGNRTLGLTDDEIAFVMWFPRQTFRIPLHDILEVDDPKSHLGKTVFQPLLRIRWRIGAGEETVAYWVRDASGWIEALQQAR